MIFLPSKPVGLKQRTRTRTPKTIASESSVEMYAFARFSITPSRIPPSIAPGMEPIPPKTAAVKARIPGMEPVVGIRVGTVEHNRTPAMAARAEPMAKVVADYQKSVAEVGGVPMVIAVERNKGYISTYEMNIFEDGTEKILTVKEKINYEELLKYIDFTFFLYGQIDYI